LLVGCQAVSEGFRALDEALHEHVFPVIFYLM
jgi:hypothetical protein